MPDMVKSIHQVFGNRIFYIPDYQRGYAWEERQCQDLLDDLELLKPGNGEHYTGTVVVRPLDDDHASFIDINMQEYEAFDIIDGQQRITTIIILLKVLHDEMQKHPESQHLTPKIQELFLHALDRNRQPFSKLKPGVDSREFFENNILQFQTGNTGPKIRSHQRMLDAKNYFTKFLQKKKETEGKRFPDWMMDFYGKIINQLNLILYEVKSESDAGVIFETMNDRGKELTEMEKVKNYLLYLSAKLELPEENHSLTLKINQTWKFIYERLMFSGLADRREEDQLLRTHWLMAYNSDTRLWHNARSIKERFNLKKYSNHHVDLLNDLLDYLDTLRKSAIAYCDIYAPQIPSAFDKIEDTKIRDAIKLWSIKLTRQGVRAGYLPILLALHQHDGTGKAYLEAIRVLEKYTFRVYLLRGRRSNTGQSSLYARGNQYFHNKNAAWLLDEIENLIEYYSSHQEFIAILDEETFNWYSWSGIKYFLYEYEYHLAGRHPSKLTWESLKSRSLSDSIEHILPQTPTDPYWLQRFSKQEHQRWVNDFSNLTLTYDNSSLSNKSFPEKKGAPGIEKTYANSPLFIERNIATYDDWTIQSLKDRREKLKSWALERWKIDAPQQIETLEDPLEKKFQEAENFGYRDGLEAIHQSMRELNSWTTVRRGIQYRYPKNFRRSLLTYYIYPGGIWVKFYPENFSKYHYQ